MDDKSTLLLVDDTESNIDILIALLNEKYDLRVATDGESALEFLCQERPDAILLDVLMPGMDGFEVMARIEGNRRTKGIPVYFISGLSEPEEYERGMSLGARGFIKKPINCRDVLGALERIGL
ncbi:MAG: response regulator [Spirochaetales bacterium]|nr:response regulator [Spirochaetales bacterium]